MRTKTDKRSRLQEVNTWIREQTGDPNDGLTEGQEMSLRDVEALCRAMNAGA